MYYAHNDSKALFMLFICTFDDINYYHYVRKYIHYDLIFTFSDMTSARWCAARRQLAC